MTELKDKIQNGLDESRMLILGAQILVGFAFRSVFEAAFPSLTKIAQNLNLIALTLLLLTLCLLIWPAAFHQIVERGRDTIGLHRFTTRAMEVALALFALGLGVGTYIPAEEIAGRSVGTIFAIGMMGVALLFWYGPFLLKALRKTATKKGTPVNSIESEPVSSTSVHDKIRHVLTEARVVLPGNQALMGFQFTVILQQGFRDLPPSLKIVHLASLSLIAISTILLLTPAPYHRIVEEGEETEGFYSVANKLVLSALPPMAAGICCDFFLVVYKTTTRWNASLAAAIAMFLLFCALWFGYTIFRRTQLRGAPRST
ncbi:MAG: DUF6328 family protein, partial [Acidobacteriota bacterium]|nr:DUF6328 family protein [Acidobacteriota bacterium]